MYSPLIPIYLYEMRLNFIAQLLAGVMLLVGTLCQNVGNWSGLKLQSAQNIMRKLESANRLINADYGKPNVTGNKNELLELENNVKNITIRVMARSAIPFLLLRGYRGQPNDSLKLTGFVGEIWNILEANLGFKTEIILKPRNQTLDWDLVLNPKEWYSKKMDRYDYTIPIAETWYLLFTKGEPDQANSTFYFRVLSGDLWLVMVAGLIFLSTYLWAVWRIRENIRKDLKNRNRLVDTKYSTCLISVLGSLINQGSQFKDVKCTPVRCVTVACIVLGYITTNSYSALLVSKLATASDTSSSKAINLDELLKNPAGRTMCVPSSSAAYKMLIDGANNQTIKNSTMKLNQPPCSKEDRGFVSLQDYCADDTVILETLNNLMNAIYSKPNQDFTCSVFIHPMKYFFSNLVLVVRRGFPYLKIINKQLKIMEESGILKKMRNKWLPRQNPDTHKLGQTINQPVTVQFDHIQTIFYLYLIMMTVSLIFFGIELIHTYQGDRKI